MAEQKEDKSMKAGRVSQTVYRRSVLKQIQNNIEGIAFLRPSQEETCYIADESEERITIATDVSLAGNEKERRQWISWLPEERGHMESVSGSCSRRLPMSPD